MVKFEFIINETGIFWGITGAVLVIVIYSIWRWRGKLEDDKEL